MGKCLHGGGSLKGAAWAERLHCGSSRKGAV